MRFFHLGLFCLTTNATIVLYSDSQERNTTFPSFDFFQHYAASPFQVSGKAIPIGLRVKNESCEVIRVIPTGISPLDTLVMVLPYNLPQGCQLECISVSFKHAAEFQSFLASKGYKVPNTLIVARKCNNPGTPIFDYQSEHITVYDGPPPKELNFQLVDVNEAELSSFMEMLNASPSIYVKSGITLCTNAPHSIKEVGNWNQYFLTSKYFILKFIFVTLATVANLGFAYRFFEASRHSGFKFLDLRNMIFLFSLISTICIILFLLLLFNQSVLLIYIWFPIFSVKRVFLDMTSIIFFASAFLTILYIWTKFLTSYSHRKGLGFILNCFIFSNLSLTLLIYTIILIHQFSLIPHTWEKSFKHYVMESLLPTVQGFLICLFIFFAGYFYTTRKTVEGISKKTSDSLLNLSILSLAITIAYVILILINQAFTHQIFINDPSLLMLATFSRSATLIIRSALVMAVLGIKKAKHDEHLK